MKQVIGEEAYLEYPRRALLDRIGMRNTVLSVDRFGDFILSSQVYTNARDLARTVYGGSRQLLWRPVVARSR